MKRLVLIAVILGATANTVEARLFGCCGEKKERGCCQRRERTCNKCENGKWHFFKARCNKDRCNKHACRSTMQD